MFTSEITTLEATVPAVQAVLPNTNGDTGTSASNVSPPAAEWLIKNLGKPTVEQKFDVEVLYSDKNYVASTLVMKNLTAVIDEVIRHATSRGVKAGRMSIAPSAADGEHKSFTLLNKYRLDEKTLNK